MKMTMLKEVTIDNTHLLYLAVVSVVKTCVVLDIETQTCWFSNALVTYAVQILKPLFSIQDHCILSTNFQCEVCPLVRSSMMDNCEDQILSQFS
jgi:hypothetical protein